ncbi:MAG: MGMT family protein [Candidatus Thermoplasmatota archaeon]|jgi:hypothetical protein|nr:MGMT family protein [Candidatus Thermoplasmatota archaeon]
MGAKSGDCVVLAPPSDVDYIMKKVPKDKLITINEICNKLAKKYNTKYCCTLTTGIFIMIASHAAEEDKINGVKLITPYWRTLKMDGFLNEKFPDGALKQKKLLENEGFKIIQKGKKYFIENYNNFIVK